MSMHSADGALTQHPDQIEKPSAIGISNPTEGSLGAGYVKTKDSQILAFDGTTNRVVIGQRNDGTWGIKVSKLGADALTGTNDQMILNSDFNQFKIVGSGLLSTNITGTTGGSFANQVAHNLGFVPAYLGYVIAVAGAPLAGKYIQLPWTSLVSGSSPVTIGGYAAISADATYVYSNLQTDTSVYNGIFTIKYYLFQETAN